MLVPKFLSKKEKIVSNNFFELLGTKIQEDIKEIFQNVH